MESMRVSVQVHTLEEGWRTGTQKQLGMIFVLGRAGEGARGRDGDDILSSAEC